MAGGRSLSTENDFLRGLALAPGLQTHGQRVAHRNSTHSFALDKTFRFIDGMTESRGALRGKGRCAAVQNKGPSFPRCLWPRRFFASSLPPPIDFEATSRNTREREQPH